MIAADFGDGVVDRSVQPNDQKKGSGVEEKRLESLNV